MIIEHATELWSADPVVTEYQTYKSLKRKNITAAEDLYYAIPWACLINDGSLKTLRSFKDLDFRDKRSFTICQHIHFEKILPYAKMLGIQTVFTPHAERHKQKIDGVTIFPYPHYPITIIEPAQKKDLLFSFIGENNHEVRDEILKIQTSHSVIHSRSEWHFKLDIEVQKENAREYREVLARSQFSLCPRGTGPSSLRLWESLFSGSIPVMLSDTLSIPPFLESSVMRVPESDASHLVDILDAVSAEEREKKMRACLELAHKIKNDFAFSIKSWLLKEE